MTRAPILSAVAAALLLGLAIAGPAAAEDAATPAASAMTPAPAATAAPVKGEFDNSCTMGLAEGQTVKTDCSVNWTDTDGKVYCFSSEASKEAFLKNPAENIQKAREFQLSKAAGSGKAKDFTEDDVNAAVKQVVDARSKDGTFVFRDPKLNADLNLVFESIKSVRGMTGYGWFATPRQTVPAASN